MFFFKKNGTIKRALVLKESYKPRSYDIMLENGQILNRNRKHLWLGNQERKFNVNHTDNEILVRKTDDKDNEQLQNETSIDGALQERKDNIVHTKTRETTEIDKKDNVVITRSKRVVKKPMYLEDYET